MGRHIPQVCACGTDRFNLLVNVRGQRAIFVDCRAQYALEPGAGEFQGVAIFHYPGGLPVTVSKTAFPGWRVARGDRRRQGGIHSSVGADVVSIVTLPRRVHWSLS